MSLELSSRHTGWETAEISRRKCVVRELETVWRRRHLVRTRQLFWRASNERKTSSREVEAEGSGATPTFWFSVIRSVRRVSGQKGIRSAAQIDCVSCMIRLVCNQVLLQCKGRSTVLSSDPIDGIVCSAFRSWFSDREVNRGVLSGEACWVNNA